MALHREGWADKSIARYMKVDRSTVYRVRKRSEEEGEQGLEDRPGGRPKGVQKVDLRAMLEVCRMQENPELGEFRVQAALERAGIHLSRRTEGRILAANREAEGLESHSRGRKEKREMPFEASFVVPLPGSLVGPQPGYEFAAEPSEGSRNPAQAADGERTGGLGG